MGCFNKFSGENIKKSDEMSLKFMGNSYAKDDIEELRGLLFQ